MKANEQKRDRFMPRVNYKNILAIPLLLLLLAVVFMFIQLERPIIDDCSLPVQAIAQVWQPRSMAHGCKDRVLDKEWFKSQSQEDEELLKWFKGMCGGTYLEMGGLDGVRFSNTHVFHKGLDWKGVLVEASPKNYKNLVRNRPNEIANVHAAVCEKRMELHWVEGRDAAVGGIQEFTPESFQKKWWTKEAIHNAQTIQCMPLKDIIEEHVGKNFFFDFFSLDIEGSEYEALASLDFDSVAFGIIVVEADDHNERKNLALRTLLESNGYIFLYDKNRSYWFANRAFASIYKDLLH
jgi:FkbM family methyltransferase